MTVGQMNKELASRIVRVVDTPEALETIEAYADMEIEKANRQLQTLTDTIQIYRLQGVVQAMNTLRRIRADALELRK